MFQVFEYSIYLPKKKFCQIYLPPVMYNPPLLRIEDLLSLEQAAAAKYSKPIARKRSTKRKMQRVVKKARKLCMFPMSQPKNEKSTCYDVKHFTSKTALNPTQDLCARVQWRTQKIFMGGFGSRSYGGYLCLVCIVCDVII